MSDEQRISHEEEGTSLYEAARNALDVIPPGPEKDALIEALLKAEGKND